MRERERQENICVPCRLAANKGNDDYGSFENLLTVFALGVVGGRSFVALVYEVRLFCTLKRFLDGVEEETIELMHILMIDSLGRKGLVAETLREYRANLVRLPTEAVRQSNG